MNDLGADRTASVSYGNTNNPALSKSGTNNNFNAYGTVSSSKPKSMRNYGSFFINNNKLFFI